MKFARVLGTLSLLAASPLALACIAPPTPAGEGGHGEHGEHGEHDEVAHADGHGGHHRDADWNPHERKTRKIDSVVGGQPLQEEEVEAPGSPQFEAPFDGAPKSKREAEGGLVIEEFAEGEGEPVQEGWSLAVHYTGYLENGLVFDSSKKRGRPFILDLGKARVIKAWTEGLKGMKAGGKRRITVPPELGYGSRAAGKIPANATLIFTLELEGAYPPITAKPKPESKFSGQAKKTELEGGIIVEDFTQGSGEPAKAGDHIKVHYIGKLESDGTEFDSSHPRGEPIGFDLGTGRVIKGWDLGLEGIKVGGLRKITIPAEMGYKDKARGKIPANSTLVFYVEAMQIRGEDFWGKKPRVGR